MTRRLLAVLAPLVLALAAVPASAGAAGSHAQLTAFQCTRALDPADRSISVQAVMRPLVAPQRLAVKFQLFVRRPGGRAHPVHAGDLGGWITPTDPTLGELSGDVWRVNKTVLNLGAPAQYRLRVLFRWTDSAGNVIGFAARRTPLCRQRELRPDLLISSLTVAPVAGQPGEQQYVAVVKDAGATGAGPFQVLFTPGDNGAPATASIPFLGAHRTQTVSFVGRGCDPADPPTLTVDAARQVDDANRANNQTVIACPAPASPEIASARR